MFSAGEDVVDEATHDDTLTVEVGTTHVPTTTQNKDEEEQIMDERPSHKVSG